MLARKQKDAEHVFWRVFELPVQYLFILVGSTTWQCETMCTCNGSFGYGAAEQTWSCQRRSKIAAWLVPGFERAVSKAKKNIHAHAMASYDGSPVHLGLGLRLGWPAASLVVFPFVLVLEIQTGLGRTFFVGSCGWWDVRPSNGKWNDNRYQLTQWF